MLVQRLCSSAHYFFSSCHSYDLRRRRSTSDSPGRRSLVLEAADGPATRSFCCIVLALNYFGSHRSLPMLGVEFWTDCVLAFDRHALTEHMGLASHWRASAGGEFAFYDALMPTLQCSAARGSHDSMLSSFYGCIFLARTHRGTLHMRLHSFRDDSPSCTWVHEVFIVSDYGNWVTERHGCLPTRGAFDCISSQFCA